MSNEEIEDYYQMKEYILTEPFLRGKEAGIEEFADRLLAISKEYVIDEDIVNQVAAQLKESCHKVDLKL